MIRLITSIFFAALLSIFAQSQELKWYTIEEAAELNKKAPRKILIDVYTDWCGWCKVMDRETFSNPAIAKILSEKYYPVKLNAEQREPIVFQGHEFKNSGEGSRPVHEFAATILNGKMSYPSIVFIDEQNRLITAVPGFKKPDQMEPLLMFIHASLYEKGVDYQQYVENYGK